MVIGAMLRSRHRQLLFSGVCRSLSSTAGDISSSSSTTLLSDPNLPKSTPRFFPRLLKTAFLSSVAATFAAVGYATYAYTADEVDAKTKVLRSSLNYSDLDTVSKVDHFQPSSLYSAVMTVPAKAVVVYLNVRRQIEERVREISEPSSDKLLPDLAPEHEEMGVLTLVLDLRETLIHHEWKRETGWATFKRPGLDDFLKHMSKFYEIVVYTDEPFVDHMMEKLVQNGVMFFLTRPATKYQDGKHYRDLSKLNRKPSKIIYVSGHALETCQQTENCVPIKPWRKEADDTTLIDLIPFLEFVGMNRPDDIRSVLASYHGKDIASEFITRSKEHQRLMLQKKRQAFWRSN